VSRPGKPTDNAFCESFNGRVRAEFLNPSYFENLAQVRRAAGIWRQDYNEFRPHSTLDNLTPIAYAQKAIDRRKSWFFTVALGPKIGLGSSKPMHHSLRARFSGGNSSTLFQKKRMAFIRSCGSARRWRAPHQSAFAHVSIRVVERARLATLNDARVRRRRRSIDEQRQAPRVLVTIKSTRGGFEVL